MAELTPERLEKIAERAVPAASKDMLALVAEVRRLQAEAASLDKMMYWLLTQEDFTLDGCPPSIEICKHPAPSSDPKICPACWREAARKAVAGG